MVWLLLWLLALLTFDHAKHTGILAERFTGGHSQERYTFPADWRHSYKAKMSQELLSGFCATVKYVKRVLATRAQLGEQVVGKGGGAG
jgi:hypothetical protein